MLTAEKATKELEKIKPLANLLIPDICLEGLSDWHRVVIERIHMDPEPKTYKGGGDDCYKDSQTGLLRLTGFALEKLSVSANIQWNLPYCSRTDGRTSPKYFSYRSVGGIRKPDGSIAWMSNTYDLDLDAEEDELTKIHTKNGGKNKSGKALDEYVRYCVDRDLTFKRKHAIKLCESGSRNRVIRKILNVKSGYTCEEMQKPFVTIRVIFQPPLDDPEVKRQLLAASIQAATGIYGNVAQTALPAPNNYGGNGDEIIEIPTEGHHTVQDPDEPIPDAADQGPDAQPDFEDLDADGQAQVLNRLASEKGFPTTIISRDDFKAGVKGITKPFHMLGDAARQKWYEYLVSLEPEPAMAEDEDIPL